MSNSSTYKHKPLKTARSIRVIKLKGTSKGLFSRSTNPNKELEVELEEVSLDSSPKYEALSYTWEGQTAERPIKCGGKVMKITRNCEAALFALRTSSERRLWIDSICIDQTSKAEKNQQIPLMGEIYGKCKQVLVWLGPGTEASTAGMKYLQDVALILRPLIMQVAMGGQAPKPGERLPAEYEEQLKVRKQAFQEENKKITGLDGSVASTSMLYDIFSRPWFTRMWTIQELVLSFKALIICGQSELTWDSMVPALAFLSQMEMNTTGLTINEWAFASIIRVYQQLRLHIHPQLARAMAPRDKRMSTLLALVHQYSCWDPKDKMYALYGYLEHEENFDNLPSWCPDWSTYSANWPFQHNRFSAARNSNLNFVFTEEGELHVAGRIIDTIKARPKTRVPPEILAVNAKKREFFLPNMVQRVQAWQEWVDLVAELKTYPNGQDLNNALLYTFVQGGFLGNLPEQVLSQDVIEQYPIWFNMLRAYQPSHASIKESCAAAIDEAVAAALQKTSTWSVYLSEEFEVEEVTQNPAWRFLIAVNTAGAQSIHHWIYRMTAGKTLFTTKDGYIGVASDLLKEGDEIVLIPSFKLPMVVRSNGDGSHRFIAPAYVHGIMEGEKWPEDDDVNALSYFVFR